MKASFLRIMLAVSIAAVADPVDAHHSYASFDMRSEVQIKGTVKEFHYSNPHTWIVLLATDATGNNMPISVEANGPGYLVRAGWNRNSLQVGDTVTLTINPMRDGSGGGSLVKVTFPDGRELKTH
jgi:hypothetical protein